jgi:deoxycytidylate deaminase
MEPMDKYAFDWAELAFSGKSGVRALDAIFIAAPRQLSIMRFTQLVKQYLPKGNLVFGLSKEPFVLGLEGQPQFAMMAAADVQPVIDKVASSGSPSKIYTLSYSQRDIVFLLEKLKFKKVVLVNGSWYRAFHLRPEFYALHRAGTPYTMVSPFAGEAEAKVFAETTKLAALPSKGQFTEAEMMALVARAARHSYDYAGFQIGTALGTRNKGSYDLLATSHNQVVPYETFAMHNGASREEHYSPMNDMNHYDTIHAEVALLLKALKQKIDISGSTLFINVLPCPSCARMVAQSQIAEVVYSEDHSAGYALTMLTKAGKKVRRVLAAPRTGAEKEEAL